MPGKQPRHDDDRDHQAWQVLRVDHGEPGRNQRQRTDDPQPRGEPGVAAKKLLGAEELEVDAAEDQQVGQRDRHQIV